MAVSNEEILEKIKAVLQRVAPEATVILFGSRARRDYRAESDVDLLILLDQEDLSIDDKKKISYPLYDLEFEYGIVISPLILTKHEWSSRPTLLRDNIDKEGVLML